MALKIKRKHTKSVKIGDVVIGAERPVAVQSMVKVSTANAKEVIKQINELEKAGCEIVRVAVKDARDAKAIAAIKRNINIPLVADIHFHYRLALEAIESGADKIRLNPGNIFKKEEVKEIAMLAKARKMPIRIGSNSGSLRGNYLKIKDVGIALVRQTHDYIKTLEDFGVNNLVISLKSSDMFETINAYRKMSRLCGYPLHLGVTATGMFYDGIVKSSLGIGILLLEGIGDTVRVSLLGDPIDEVVVAKNILSGLGVRKFGPKYICCPTCGRCEVDLRSKAKELISKLGNVNKDLSRTTVALMGCMVNGPGEAKHADIGIAFGRDRGILFRKSKIVDTLKEERCIDVLISQLNGGLK
ncbi:MAG: flavodoxin-dependent (E)-4-hydroxy-3-methylbut-2-enyl-diphosphate synthase [Candidatus Omnitrophica bacterium]|nr:flavodoxin-dependent (E)-4-hydroxy-3-methylbut-2-enyl-diphosphate synthase [Candidatus Omnitrophota bacterium]